MNIYLGNLTVEQIESRAGITLSEQDRTTMRENHQSAVNNTPLESGKWHCFDLPFMLMTHDKQTAETYLDLLGKYDWSKCKEAFQIGWEN